MTEFAPAKINLTLHVTGRLADGYHLLDSLVAFADVGDRLLAIRAGVSSLTLAGPFGAHVPADRDNLVMQATELLSGAQGVAFTLEKRLPPASGIGGGSADAAAAIRAALRQDADDPEAVLARLAALDRDAVLGLGADLPVCLLSRPARMRGIGERLDLVPFPEVPLLLVNPGVEVPTGAVFAALTKADNPAMPDDLPAWADVGDLARWLAGQRNDLEPPARTIAPEIEAVLAALAAQRGAMIARMSGSGATCFALFPDLAAAERAGAAISKAQPGWWVAPGQLYPADAAEAARINQLMRSTT
ncbi:MAG: 4-(cytidine 5'-diphospho)-2-C-methyl-D-erythritol kinase [Alphaproteobacteria bacterium HGW-Alphaproteobacteria-6]|nr:MAG: 4-(cytidine 5'-diphospho)-2-C-methyl-D-erythritol kinase [Alphaproteobacteria bacterium HGW-Alphaproteobacteria-6]